jgi:hypothetical protein
VCKSEGSHLSDQLLGATNEITLPLLGYRPILSCQKLSVEGQQRGDTK